MPSPVGKPRRTPIALAFALASASIVAAALAGCATTDTTQSVRPKRIAVEPTIGVCSSSPTQCTSGNRLEIRRAREAKDHLCPRDKPNVLVKADGTLVCMIGVPVAGPTAIGLSPPSSVRAGGASAVAEFKHGEVVAARSGCLACHRIAEAGNPGPGPALTQVGSRLPARAIDRALVASPAPMPSFSRLPAAQRRALVYFLANLR